MAVNNPKMNLSRMAVLASLVFSNSIFGTSFRLCLKRESGVLLFDLYSIKLGFRKHQCTPLKPRCSMPSTRDEQTLPECLARGESGASIWKWGNSRSWVLSLGSWCCYVKVNILYITHSFLRNFGKRRLSTHQPSFIRNCCKKQCLHIINSAFKVASDFLFCMCANCQEGSPLFALILSSFPPPSCPHIWRSRFTNVVSLLSSSFEIK